MRSVEVIHSVENASLWKRDGPRAGLVKINQNHSVVENCRSFQAGNSYKFTTRVFLINTYAGIDEP